jgi:hypothetical protein
MVFDMTGRVLTLLVTSRNVVRRGKKGQYPPRHVENVVQRGKKGQYPPRHVENVVRHGKEGQNPPRHASPLR